MRSRGSNHRRPCRTGWRPPWTRRSDRRWAAPPCLLCNRSYKRRMEREIGDPWTTTRRRKGDEEEDASVLCPLTSRWSIPPRKVSYNGALSFTFPSTPFFIPQNYINSFPAHIKWQFSPHVCPQIYPGASNVRSLHPGPRVFGTSSGKWSGPSKIVGPNPDRFLRWPKRPARFGSHVTCKPVYL